jgi:diaminopimelate decarboxylase
MTVASPFRLDDGEPFSYRDGVLHVGGLAVDQLAGAAGTPVYLYDLDVVAAAYRRLEAAFRPGRVLYSVKANSNLALLRRLAALGAGFDVVSGGELLRVLRAGGRPGRIVFAGVGKTREELRLAARSGVVVHVESADELAALQVAAAEVGATACFGLRVNPDVKAGPHPYLRTGHDETKFGLPASTAVELFGRVAAGGYPNLNPVGVHVHVGSQLADPGELAAGARVALGVLHAGRRAGLALDRIDVGGGLPVAYDGGAVASPEAFAAAVARLLAGSGARLQIEPGRALVARAGALVASVLATKPWPAGRAVVVDTGMHHLLRPALYRARHRVVPVRLRPPAGLAWLVGPICESADVLAAGVPLPDLGPGDLVAVLDAGAYGMVMASNYNGQPRPAEVVVTGGEALMTRRRETWKDLLAWESGPARRLPVSVPPTAMARSPSTAHQAPKR